MSWLDYGPLLSIVVGYLAFLFGVAWAAERSPWLQAPRLQMLTYVLAASVYCTAWTFYGSVGLAAQQGLEFLTIYLGPALVALLWPFLLGRLVRVAKEQRITSVSDFISSRYGKSAPLGALVAALVALGLIPYIALQLQAVSRSFKLILGQETILEVFDPTLLVAVVLGVFGILFGARNPDFTRVQRGLLTAVAVESVVKLLAFLTVGAYVTWGLFGGFGDIFGRVLADPELSRLVTLGEAPSASFARWAAMLFVSMMAVMFLPRQFHVLVVQNQAESHIRAAAWLFPLYLLLINLFVLPIAFAGLMLLPRDQADQFVLLLPLSAGVPGLAVLVFLGGFSAATAMIVVDSLAVSKMLTNDVVVPILLRNRTRDVYRASLHSMRWSILVVVFLGYVWTTMAGGKFLLVEMGLLSFVAVTQCAPAILLGLVWPRGNRHGAFAGLSAGFGLWFYTLIVPALAREGFFAASILSDGPLGLAWLRPTALLGLDGLDSVSHGLFWSLLVNLAAFVLVSLATQQNAEEWLQAAAFTGRFPGEDGAPMGHSVLSPPEIERLVHHYVGGSEAAVLAKELLGDEPARERSASERLELRIGLEKRLAASLGAAAARFIVEDRFALSTGQAEQLVASFQELRHSLRTTEEEARRTEHLLASVEAKIRRLVDANIIGVVIWGVDGRIIEANDAFLEMVGYSRNDLVAGRIQWTDMTPAEWRAQDRRRLDELKATGRSNPVEKEYFRKDGSRVPALVGAATFEDRRDEGVAFVLDLTDRKRAEEALRKSQAELAHVTRVATLGEMTGSIAHEINQPLGAVVNNASACLRWLAAQNLEEARQSAARVIADGHRASAIVGRIRALAKKTPPRKDWLDINDTLREVIVLAQNEVHAHRVLLQARLAEPLPPVWGDRIQVQQVALNLLMNAIEAMSGAGDGPRELWLSTAEESATHVVISVRDSGPGLDVETLDRLFDAFYTTKPEGLGMGLTISRSIVESHGGRLWATANVPRGAVFQFSLPTGRETPDGPGPLHTRP